MLTPPLYRLGRGTRDVEKDIVPVTNSTGKARANRADRATGGFENLVGSYASADGRKAPRPGPPVASSELRQSPEQGAAANASSSSTSGVSPTPGREQWIGEGTGWLLRIGGPVSDQCQTSVIVSCHHVMSPCHITSDAHSPNVIRVMSDAQSCRMHSVTVGSAQSMSQCE